MGGFQLVGSYISVVVGWSETGLLASDDVGLLRLLKGYPILLGSWSLFRVSFSVERWLDSLNTAMWVRCCVGSLPTLLEVAVVR